MRDDLTAQDLSSGGPVCIETWLGAPARSYPGRPPSVTAVLSRANRLWPEQVALIDVDGSEVTYSEFAGLVQTTSHRLREAELVPGDAVAVAAGNCIALATLLFACANVGTVMIGLNTRSSPSRWSYMMAHSKVRLALTSPEFADQLVATGHSGVHGLGEFMSSCSQTEVMEPAERPQPDTAYAVVYTSGTTGRPKASEVVHRASIHSGMSFQRVLQLRCAERTAVLFPLYYISAMHAHLLPAMLAGATCVLLDRPSPREYVASLARHSVSWAYTVPAFWALVLRKGGLNRRELPQLERVGSGGAPFPRSVVTALRTTLPGTRLYDVYGLSETHGPATVLLDHEFEQRPGSVGRPLQCMEAEVRDSEGIPCSSGQAGELWLRGSLVTTGYAGDPAATARAIVDGWLDTGDVARIDPEGYVYILDRTKDMINRGGDKIFSAEVEAVLGEHPGITDVAIVGTPHRASGEAVVAFVVLEEGESISGPDVRRWVRDRMASYAAPRYVHFVDSLPRNAVGKTDKALLRIQAALGARDG